MKFLIAGIEILKTNLSMNTSIKNYLLLLLGFPLIIFILIAIFNYTIDPYMLWHEKPIWFDKTKNPIIDSNQRLIKSLQLVLRQPKIIFLGSSLVYHVINPAGSDEKIYNLGVGSLRSAEAYGYVKEAVSWTPVTKIYLALDLFAFGSEQKMPGYDDEVSGAKYLVNQFASALIGKSTINDSLNILLGKNAEYNDGTWQFNGYKLTPKRNLAEVNDGIKQNEILFKKIFPKTSIDYINQNLKNIEKIMTVCEAHHVELVLYFNPINYRLLQVYKNSGVWDNFMQLKTGLQAMAYKHNVTLWDFATYSSITTYPFVNENEIKRNPYYLDTDHPTELVGNYVMQQMGVPLKKPLSIPRDFGVRLNQREA